MFPCPVPPPRTQFWTGAKPAPAAPARTALRGETSRRGTAARGVGARRAILLSSPRMAQQLAVDRSAEQGRVRRTLQSSSALACARQCRRRAVLRKQGAAVHAHELAIPTFQQHAEDALAGDGNQGSAAATPPLPLAFPGRLVGGHVGVDADRVGSRRVYRPSRGDGGAGTPGLLRFPKSACTSTDSLRSAPALTLEASCAG